MKRLLIVLTVAALSALTLAVPAQADGNADGFYA